ncbi:endoplasmic reticulum auxin efflux carrier [Rhizoctonia solani]|uniref:Endoplasmic reticulum auxin efflux carrier n=1 Tax=Rhizoctonia solani TaxID=456999 RepID=A0A8H8SZ41_9AGAM|nr:endoplasmic reticulum auxin efflux carrier [Rhizoctonia solani]QRW23034.1 endoplasmic reticulum auxin efflux carrier [Rhizoctonia solani]
MATAVHTFEEFIIITLRRPKQGPTRFSEIKNKLMVPRKLSSLRPQSRREFMNALKSQPGWPDLVRRRLTHWHPTTCQGLVIRHHSSTMRLRSSAFLWLWALRYVSALEESEAGVIDWHKELVGVPLTDSTKA